MKKKKDTNFYLQHKLPWESEWIDTEVGKSTDCKEFMKILEEEPPHLIETEYRIIQKKTTELRNNNKSIICPVCIINGSDLATKFKELRLKNS